MATLLSDDACAPGRQGKNEDAVRSRRVFAVRHGEPSAAGVHLGNGQWLSMARDDTCSVTDVRAIPIRCRAGTLWITSTEYPGHTVVVAGDKVSMTSRGTIMVTALDSSSMWVPKGFAVHDEEDISRRRTRLKALRPVTRLQRLAAWANDEPRGTTVGMARLPEIQKFIVLVRRIFRASADTADAREHYLSQSIDHGDFENRVRTWGAHEARLRRLPQVL